MTPAWQRREAQRQMFIQDLCRKTDWREEGDPHIPEFYFRLAEVCLRYLKHAQELEDGLIEKMPALKPEDEVEYWFFTNVWNTLFDFSRSSREHNVLVATYFEGHVVQRVLSPFSRALDDQTRENPRLILHAESATEEVPFFEEE